jgi:signal transduction histidine kinase
VIGVDVIVCVRRNRSWPTEGALKARGSTRGGRISSGVLTAPHGAMVKFRVSCGVISPPTGTLLRAQLARLPSLRQRTLLLTLLPLAVVAVIVAVLTVAVANRALTDYIAGRNQLIVENIQIVCDPLIAAGDLARATTLVAASARASGPSDIWITDANNVVVVSSIPEAVGKPLLTSHLDHLVSAPRSIAGSGARVVLYEDQRLQQEVATVVGAGSVLALTLGLLVTGWLVSRQTAVLTTPVVLAAEAATAMADGDFEPAQALSPSALREGEALRLALHHTARRLAEATSGLEQQVEVRTAQLEMAKSQAQAARELAEEASTAKSVFLANMSHELRTPLNAIIGYAELVQEELEGIDVTNGRQDAMRIVESARHLLALINDILDYSKLEAGRMRVHRETYQIETIVAAAVATVAPLVTRNRVTLSTEIAPGIGEGVGDALKLTQILINLLGNSAKFTQEGVITVQVSLTEVSLSEHAGPTLVIGVRDSGIGLDAAQQDKLFKPFMNAETQRRYGGTGLGLAICAHYCRLMRGSISCSSSPGEGALFTVRLPLRLQPDTGTFQNSGTTRGQRRPSSRMVAADRHALRPESS